MPDELKMVKCAQRFEDDTSKQCLPYITSAHEIFSFQSCMHKTIFIITYTQHVSVGMLQ